MNQATIEFLKDRFAQKRAEGLRARDAALAMGLAEGQAVAIHVGHTGVGCQARVLRPGWIELLQQLEACGPLMALTRNESVVHEKTGVYEKVSGSGHVGLALGKDIDLRLFPGRWHEGFAVREVGVDGKLGDWSMQFYDETGDAVHKVFVREATDRARWQQVIDQHSLTDPVPVQFEAKASPPEPKPDSEIDATGLRDAWAAMTDTHEFFGLLKKFEVERQQSLRLTRGVFAHELPTQAVRTLLNEAAVDGLPIMVFVGNPGCIQIHTGPIRRVEPMGPWLNVLDEGFNLHLREDLIAHVWRVDKPTADGVVTSVEVFSKSGELMVMFFGERKPGKPELPEWRRLALSLEQVSAEVSA